MTCSAGFLSAVFYCKSFVLFCFVHHKERVRQSDREEGGVHFYDKFPARRVL